MRLIAEIKHRSPSAGPLSTTLSVAERAAAYERGGADLVSVLCDVSFFGGSFENLDRARTACTLPLLCKDFIIDEVQLNAARAWGADAILLIVRCVNETILGQLVDRAFKLELEPLVEVTTLAEASVALKTRARWIGVNARDLDTLELDPARARRVLNSLPERVTRLYLSGIHKESEIQALRSSPADALLLGEILMRQENPEPLMKRFVAAANERTV